MELKNIITQMDTLKAELDSLRPLREDHLNRLNQKLRLDWNYHSNSIEGNTLSASETRAFILFGTTAKGKPFRDYLEMRGHNEALLKLEQIVQKNVNLTENIIKDLHKMILVEPYTDKEAEINPGHYKTVPNYLYSPTGERIDFLPPEEVVKEMNELINWVNNHISPPKRKKKKYDLHPLLVAAGFHAKFIQIHPFGDGNGRMARICTNLILMLCGYVPAIIKLDERVEYYNALNASGLNEPEPFAEFLGNACIQSLELAIKAGKGENISEDEDWIKRLDVLVRGLEEGPVQAKTSTIIYERYQDSFRPLFDELKELKNQFDPLFEKSNVREDAYIQTRADMLSPEELDARMLAYKNQDKLIEVTSFKISMEWRGFLKNGTNTFSLFANVEISLDSDYNYSIKASGLEPAPWVEKLYTNPLTALEIHSLVNQIGNQCTERIAQSIKPNKNP